MGPYYVRSLLGMPSGRQLILYSRLAATIFQTFVASDTASETLVGLKRIHGLMPYFMLKGILKISNPMAMIRGGHEGIPQFIHKLTLDRCSRSLSCPTFWWKESAAKDVHE